MKNLITTTTLILLVINLMAQIQPKAKNNVHIDNATDFKIYGSDITIGQIIINQAVKSKILFAKATQSIDTIGQYKGKYKTMLFFTGQDHVPFLGTTILLQFNKHVLSCKLFANGMYNIRQQGLSKDSTAYLLRASQIIADGFWFRIYSNTPVFTTIQGVDGIYQ